MPDSNFNASMEENQVSFDSSLEETTRTFTPEFEDFVTVYRGVNQVWIGNGTTGDNGVLYAEYPDGAVQNLGPVTGYYYALQQGYTGTFAEWVQIILDGTTNAESAAASATAAATSASNASTSETNAATSATNASTSETNAATSAQQASNHRGAASISATDAYLSELNAKTSENNAAASATFAEAREQEAGFYASNASNYADNAQLWATGGSSGTPSVTNNAKYFSELAEQWATGSTSGTPSVTNNASYYATQSSNSATSAAASATQAAADASSVRNMSVTVSYASTNSSPDEKPTLNFSDHFPVFLRHYLVTQLEFKWTSTSGTEYTQYCMFWSYADYLKDTSISNAEIDELFEEEEEE